MFVDRQFLFYYYYYFFLILREIGLLHTFFLFVQFSYSPNINHILELYFLYSFSTQIIWKHSIHTRGKMS
jgi:hypothetical protein